MAEDHHPSLHLGRQGGVRILEKTTTPRSCGVVWLFGKGEQ